MLEEKIDALTKEIVALRKTMEANGGAAPKSAAASSDDAAEKPKRGRGRPAKEEASEPEHSQDEVETIIRKVSKDVGKPAAVSIIKSFKCDDLADLLSHPEHFDAAYAKAEEALDAPAEEEEDDI